MAEALRHLVQALGPYGLPILAVAATTEYLFPPFPGDTVTVFGAYLAVTGRLPFIAVWLAVTAGSGVGLSIDWWVGRWLAGHRDRLPAEAVRPWWQPLSRERLARFEVRYRRYGDPLILVNRFIPALRAFIFLAAGAAEIPLPRVVVLGLVSAGIWNALLLGAGFAVGKNLGALESLLRDYGRFAWAVLILLGVLVAARLLLRRVARGD